MIKEEIKKALQQALKELGIENVEPHIEHPKLAGHGDYSSNVALATFSNAKFKMQSSKFKNPLELAQAIQNNFKFHPFDKLRTRISNSRLQLPSQSDGGQVKFLDRVEVVPPGFLNFWLSRGYLLKNLQNVLDELEQYGRSSRLRKSSGEPKKIMLEFADPNPFKEFHIGHLRNIVLGESFARLLEAQGADVWRVNYQGDVGMHVAKAIYGLSLVIPNLSALGGRVQDDTLQNKIKLLGKAYALGAKAYEEDEKARDQIREINIKIYRNDPELQALWEKGREWSLAHFEEIYKRVGTQYKHYYFESEVALVGKEIVLSHVQDGIFEKHDGAVVFRGSHTRVFVTKEDYATYEAKDMALAGEKYKDFPYDRSIIITAHEQAPYFTVVLEALAKVFPDLASKTQHYSFGFVALKEEKMSSRKGNVITSEWLLDEAKTRIRSTFKDMDEETAEVVAIGAVKYSMLKFGRESDIQFSFDESISLEGNSGPYVQYTFARTQSVVRKANTGVIPNLFRDLKHYSSEMPKQVRHDNAMEQEEIALLRILHRFPEVVKEAAKSFSPNLLCAYLFDLSQAFNLFYQKHSILSSANSGFRINLTAAVGQTLKNGLNLLGIQSPERM